MKNHIFKTTMPSKSWAVVLLLLFFIPVRSLAQFSSDFEKEFWPKFQHAVASNNSNEVLTLTCFPFYNSSSTDKATFQKYYGSIIDADEKIMVKYAKCGKKISPPARPNESGVTYEPGASIDFREVVDTKYLATLHTKLKLPSTAKVYLLTYSYDMELANSSHPEQSNSSQLFFAQTKDGFKFCGKGMIF